MTTSQSDVDKVMAAFGAAPIRYRANQDSATGWDVAAAPAAASVISNRAGLTTPSAQAAERILPGAGGRVREIFPLLWRAIPVVGDLKIGAIKRPGDEVPEPREPDSVADQMLAGRLQAAGMQPAHDEAPPPPQQAAPVAPATATPVQRAVPPVNEAIVQQSPAQWDERAAVRAPTGITASVNRQPQEAGAIATEAAIPMRAVPPAPGAAVPAQPRAPESTVMPQMPPSAYPAAAYPPQLPAPPLAYPPFYPPQGMQPSPMIHPGAAGWPQHGYPPPYAPPPYVPMSAGYPPGYLPAYPAPYPYGYPQQPPPAPQGAYGLGYQPAYGAPPPNPPPRQRPEQMPDRLAAARPRAEQPAPLPSAPRLSDIFAALHRAPGTDRGEETPS
jgi:hypothetical protein